MGVLIAFYVCGIIVYGAISGLAWHDAYWDETKRRARLCLLTPVWPLVVFFLLGGALFEIMRDAFSKE
jgi:hypothetical protein